ncbi:MAG: hypothetical protein AAGA93_27365, partial [Actinomycetota bacterium]
MSDHDDIDDDIAIDGVGAGAEIDTDVDITEVPVEHESVFTGHDAKNGMHHLAIPELAGASTIAQASAGGSPKARRQARILGWLLLLTFAAP